MRRIRFVVSFALLGAVVSAACSESPTGLETLAAETATSLDAGFVPFHAVFDEMSSYVAPGPDCPVLTVFITGTGRSSHLGRTTVVQHHCIDPFGPDPLAFSNGRFEATGANGDAVLGIYAGASIPTAEPTELAWIGAWEFTGGTGRFAGASGQGDGSGLNNLATGGGTSELTGSISTVGGS